MVLEQLLARKISSREVLKAMEEIPRHLFVDQGLAAKAYDDGPLPIGYGQTISQPYMVAMMTQALELSPNDRVLEIGSGCGYQTAVLASICREVYSIERLEPLLTQSLNVLKSLGYNNVTLKLGDGQVGWPQKAPFNAVLVAAYAERTPKDLVDQLAPGGHLVIPLGAEDSQLLVLTTKNLDGSFTRKTLLGCRFVPLVSERVKV
ncbi:MAG: protein-L-isoaspartate(D-aspartate) O-methyltransferase [Deltaproteobacteria bacterium]|jgi:protein-L-isoaspartate(D-aspartate) O-methyltransferase|nr:protein-L-isoaspartate(D-aspartate) O-methyltransferase [Deltaproteobacteria bacterium]